MAATQVVGLLFGGQHKCSPCKCCFSAAQVGVANCQRAVSNTSRMMLTLLAALCVLHEALKVQGSCLLACCPTMETAAACQIQS